ncbi:MAG: MmgE/PrpD family protein [Rhodospirillaceae bacterium]
MSLSQPFDRVIDYVTGLTYEALPSSVTDAARSVFFDTVGVVIGAQRQPIAVKLGEYLALSSEPGVSTAICGFRRVSSTTAAFSNGAISHDLELDDYHQTSALHAAAVLVPAAIAVGEQTDATAHDILLALAGGYEIACRLAFMMDPEKLYFAGFHPTTVCGAVGAAAVAASLMKLPSRQYRQACYLAMGLMSGIMACKTEPDHYTKSYQCGVAARNGVIAAQRIADGFEYDADPSSVLRGTLRAYTGAVEPRDGVSGLGQRFEITRTGYKLYACCRHIYPLLDALAEIRRQATIDSSNVAKMTLNLYARGAVNVGGHSLRTHNARYVMAMALEHGVPRREYFTEAFGMEEVRPVMDRIELVADDALQAEWPGKTPGVVTVDTRDGRRLSARVDHPKGGPENPAGLPELREKFFGLVAPIVGQERCETIAEMLSAPTFKLRDVTATLTARDRMAA